ncbi:membrane-associated phospholipid phosphatase [Methanofollis sp. W23]|uniref:phosphatase PAP2 family protein n=1 Tax=Methanofollis sp. W23 TaxID=2817849 RepID=UPI001AE74CE0|nr:phosphatase PAP2 family protein [Methanofollis sp. W23]MBP2146098.1 membrane-associated phospholipid phosphatase [Methanofollis sp. W23]
MIGALLTETEIVLDAQAHLGWTAPFWTAVSFTGSAAFFLLILPLVYWCVSPRLGLRLGLLLTVSVGVNTSAKLLFATPRPYWVSAAVHPLATHPSFSMPSGHAQNAVPFWGLLAAWTRWKRWAVAAATVLILLTGFSRVVLGVHFPGDVLAGWAIGAILLLGFLWLERPVSAWAASASWPAKIAVLLLGATALAVPAATAVFFLQAPLPPAWTRTAAHPLDPYSMTPALLAAGALLGTGAGAAWTGTAFRTGGRLRMRAARYLLGMLIALLITAPLVLVSWWTGGAVAWLLDLVLPAALGFWMAGGAPRLFARAGLMEPEEVNPTGRTSYDAPNQTP